MCICTHTHTYNNMYKCMQHTHTQHLTCLSEFYASCNSVTNSRELFQLKCLQHLVVVDLTNNPLCATPTYRAFAIYHLSSLRALDGQPIVSLIPSKSLTFLTVFISTHFRNQLNCLQPRRSLEEGNRTFFTVSVGVCVCVCDGDIFLTD